MSDHIPCQICGKPGSLIHQVPFCEDHFFEEYERRQSQGVISEELDPTWLDTLNNWQQRPPELDKEIAHREDATPLRFSFRFKKWLLFVRQYYRDFPPSNGYTGPRLYDGLAIHMDTHEKKYYTNISVESMKADLQNRRKASYQVELLPLWGKIHIGSLHFSWAAKMYEGQRKLQLYTLFSYTPFSVFGLGNNPFQLQFRSIPSWGAHDYYVDRLSFLYTTDDSTKSIEVESKDIQLCISNAYEDYKALIFSDQHFLTSITSHYRQLTHRSIPDQISPSYIWKEHFQVDKRIFEGEIFTWTDLPDFSFFAFQNNDIILSGYSIGLTREQLSTTLTSLRTLNHSPLINLYQSIIDGNT